MGTTPQEELCLRWNDFESILSRSFTDMRAESDFFDVRIACYDKAVMKTLPAHRVVLSACSPVLKELLRAIGSDTSANGPLIFLRGIAYQKMEAILDFMYNGQTKVNHTDLDAFLAAAEELKIKGLTNSSNSNENSTPSRKRSNLHPEVETKKVKKIKPAPPPSPAPKSPSPTPGPSAEVANVMVKSEAVHHEVEADIEDVQDLEPGNDDSYQEYPEGEGPELEETFDESAYQEDGAPMDAFPRDSKDYFDPSNEERNAILGKWIVYDSNLAKDKCKICGHFYKTADRSNGTKQLQNHIEGVHFQIEAFPCYYCPKIYTSKHRRSNHISYVHQRQNREATGVTYHKHNHNE